MSQAIDLLSQAIFLIPKPPRSDPKQSFDSTMHIIFIYVLIIVPEKEHVSFINIITNINRNYEPIYGELKNTVRFDLIRTTLHAADKT